MKRRSRSRERTTGRSSGTPRYLVALFLLGAGVLLLATVFNSAAFSLVDLDRSGSIDVVSDSNGALSLDTVSAVSVGNRERLVTMTNRLNQSVSVTASIVSGSGTLYVGSQSGNSVSFSLTRAASQTVDVQAGGTGGEQIDYEIRAVGPGINATIPRSVQTLSTGQAAPGFPGSFNDLDYTQGEEAPGENNSIPPGANAQGKMSNFPNMQEDNDGGAFAELDKRNSALNIGVRTNDTPDVDAYEIKLRYRLPHWSADATLNVVDASGSVLQSRSLTHTTQDNWRTIFMALNSAAENFVDANGELYVTYTGSGDVQMDIDYQRIQENPPPPEAAFSVSCSGQDCTFDASASSGFGKPIVSYEWDFGDGTTTTVSGSVTSHTYASNGTYNVKLTVENTAGEMDTTSQLVTVGTLSVVTVPPDVYDDVDYTGEQDAPEEDSSIPPPQAQGNKVENFANIEQVDGNVATFPGNPMDIGVATFGVSDQGSSYALEIRHAQDSWEGTVEVLIVDANNTVLQSHTLPKTGSLTNTTIQFNAAAEAYVKDTGSVYVRYHKTTGGWVSLEIDAQFVKVTP